ncbi:ABC transporter substrate-binding protein [Arenibacterium sp. LLYu02]|uniref:ABC transporter substrate-binding protein n=1 Tax=Arenibacterium sp. LLYu02 TaxID=3404132 RepID=UPI003B215C74
MNLKTMTAVALIATASGAIAEGTVTAGALKIGTDLTYPPYNYFDDQNAPAGFDVELMTALAEKAGLSAEFLDTRFENLILGVNGGQFDVIASTLYVKPERAERIDYIPYMKTGVSIAVAETSGKSFATPNDLCGATVASIKGAAWLEDFAKLNEGLCNGNPIDSREFPTSPEATQALLSGGVDAQVEDSAVLGSAAAKLNGRLMISSTEQFYPVIVGLGVQKGNEALAAEIREALAELEADGTYPALLAKYNVAKPSDEEFRAALGQ